MPAKPLSGLLSLGLVMALASTVSAAPLLRSDIVVTGAVVTIGDMFEDAGPLAGQAIFRAPSPGTAGIVPLDAVRNAARNAGLVDFIDDGVAEVRVARAATQIDRDTISALITADLTTRGILGRDMLAELRFEGAEPQFFAEAVEEPVRLVSLRYLPGNGSFSARVLIAGHAEPIDLSGNIDLMIMAPHLVQNLPAGTILGPEHIEMRAVDARIAESNGFVDPEYLIGKQLQRQNRAGVMLRPSDVTEPQIVSRNEQVTVYFRNGPMTLSVKGQALNAASLGQPVAVLNLVSRKVVHGRALANGAVEITSLSPLKLAGL
ncbi:flagellar basal body P-ring formation protein FlgA [Arsenicitalea aurantiaca]|uniref:Flagellar basal body P-ring formation protein FlgA n=1 Tax=Arsenicitalea aurantiaca TaxID=1783274 RepID=A0A433XG84_9HYPH|nr:flagellar basal body P-ring formation chaperone FlgA [Arsenicitalea aurantiaca]RUT33127.1 flagellar basal body P-ring formation protein FlgA [Arsenicitalea aurantiaca]